MLVECHQCDKLGFGSVILFLWNTDETLRFCSLSCKRYYQDTHPSERGNSDPRYDEVR
jgi:hypothetical protein